MNSKKIAIPAAWVVFVYFVLSFTEVSGVSKMNSPDEFKSPNVRNTSADKSEEAVSNIVFGKFIFFFRNVISPLDGPRSPSYPTGSAYGSQIVKKYGFIFGSILIADRLFHETDYYHGKYIDYKGTLRYYDPPEFNTYWWEYSAEKSTPDTD